MVKLVKSILIILLAILTVLIFNEPGPIWLFAIFLIVYLLRNPIRKTINQVLPKLSIKYFLAGFITGMFIEFLAILNNMKLPPEQRVLFHPDPIADLILGAGQYIALTVGTYFILKKCDFSIKEFFVLGGVFGLVVEQHGGILMQLLNGNILGGIYVFLSYSSLLAFPYMLFSKDFSDFNRTKSIIPKYVIAVSILVFFYALFLLYILLMYPLFGT